MTSNTPGIPDTASSDETTSTEQREAEKRLMEWGDKPVPVPPEVQAHRKRRDAN